VIILVIDEHGIGAFKRKSQPPVLVYPNCPMTFHVALERVPFPAGNIHLLRRARFVEHVQHVQQPLRMMRLYARLWCIVCRIATLYTRAVAEIVFHSLKPESRVPPPRVPLEPRTSKILVKPLPLSKILQLIRSTLIILFARVAF